MAPTSQQDDGGNPKPPWLKKMLIQLSNINEALDAWKGLATKAVVLGGGMLALVMMLNEIFWPRGLVLSSLDVPSDFSSQGYTGKLISRQIAQQIQESSKDVPRKLTFMFASDRVGEDRRRLEQNISRRYNSEHEDVNVAINLGLADFPIELMFESLRKLTGVESKRVVGILANQNGMLVYNVGYLHSATGASYETFSESFAPDGKGGQSIQEAMAKLVAKGAKFSLKHNNPIVYVLDDYRAQVAYSSSQNTWCDKSKDDACDLERDERVAILERVADTQRNTVAAQLAHSLLGDIYESEKDFAKAVSEYELAIAGGNRFANLVGIKLANRYLYEADLNNGKLEKGRALLLKMLKLDPDGRLPFVRLLALSSRELELVDDRYGAERSGDYAAKLRDIVAHYEKLLRISANSSEKVSVYKGMLAALAKLSNAVGDRGRFYSELQRAVAEGLVIHEHELAFAPYSEVRHEQRFLEILEAAKRRQREPKQSDQAARLLQSLTHSTGGREALEDSAQVLLVVNADRHDVAATMHAFEKRHGEWKPVFADMSASIGRNGFSEPYRKREGDGTAPSGVYRIGHAFGYDSAEKVQTRLAYRQAEANEHGADYWIDDAASPDYNTWVRIEGGGPPKHRDPKSNEMVVSSYERLRRDDHLYKYGIVVEYNNGDEKFHPADIPVVGGKPKGSAIFLHWERAPGAPTAGCVATSRENLLDLLKWLDPDKNPTIVMGSVDDLLAGFPRGD